MKTFIKLASYLLTLILAFTMSCYGQDKLETGKKALEQKDYVKAIDLLRDYARKEKKDPRGYFFLGKAYLAADSTDQAVGALIQARELDSANAEIYVMLGDAYAKQGLSAAAIQQFARAGELDSTKVSIFLRLAEANRKTRQYTDAARAYSRVLALDSTNLGALKELSKLLVRGKQWGRAAEVLERLGRVLPDSLDVQIQLVRAYSETRNYEKLKPIAENVVKRDPSQMDVKGMLAEAYRETKDCERAVNLYSQLNPDSMKMDEILALAKCQKALDSVDASIKSFERAYRKDTTVSEVYYDLGTLYMKKKRYADAVTMFDRKIAADTTSGYRFACYLNAAMCLMQMKQFKEAKEYIMHAIELRPESLQAWMTLAQDDAQLSLVDEQRAAYRKVIELAMADTTNGHSGKYNNQLEEAYRMEGLQLLLDKKYAPAIDFLKKSLAVNPKDCQTTLWLAQAYHNSNNKEEAKKYYCRVIDLCPKAKEAKDAEKGLEVLGLKCGE